MASAREYREYFQGLDRQRLMDLWASAAEGEPPEPDDWTGGPWQVGRWLDYLVIGCLRVELDGGGYPDWGVQWPFEVTERELLGQGASKPVEQIDGVLHLPWGSFLIECKAGGQESIEALAKLRNQLARRSSAAMGIMVSLGGFSPAALQLARFMSPQLVLLWERSDVDWAVKNKRWIRGLWRKYTHAIEKGVPNLSLDATEAP